MELNFYWDPDKKELKVASLSDVIAARIIIADQVVQELSPGGQITISTTVSNTELYGWLRRTGLSIFNKFLARHEMDKIIQKVMLQNGHLGFGWDVDKSIGKYRSLETKKLSTENSYTIILNGTPMPVVREIATALRKAFRQETVLIHDLEKNTYYYWG